MNPNVLKSSDIGLAYLDNEKVSPLTLVFIHGNSSRGQAFAKQFYAPELESYRMIALDLPGHGSSTVSEKIELDPVTFSYNFYTSLLANFIAQLKLTNVVLIGHSLGGHIAIGASDKIPLKGLVISQTPPLESMANSLEAFNHELPVLAILYNPEASDDQAETVFDTFASSEELKAELRSSWKQTSPHFRAHFAASLGAPDFVPEEVSKLRALKCPWTILEAKNDPALCHSYFTQNELLKDHLVELIGSKHYPQFEDSSAYNQELVSFLRMIEAAHS